MSKEPKPVLDWEYLEYEMDMLQQSTYTDVDQLKHDVSKILDKVVFQLRLLDAKMHHKD